MCTVLADYIAASGRTQNDLAREFGVTQPSFFKWIRGQVPAERVLAVSRATGLSPHALRPDVFGPEGGVAHATDGKS